MATSAATPGPLTAAQTHALFDIVIHHQLYAEIEAFKYPAAIHHYGYPFRKADGVQTTSPLLQVMLNKFLLTNPALRGFQDSFWEDKVGPLIARLAAAELSESYDKGAIGSRKALATAASSILEYVARGMLGGYPVTKSQGQKQSYDTSKPEDVAQGFDDLMHGVIYGDLLDVMFDQVKATGRLEDHTSVVQAAHEYILLHVASFLHHIFVKSPDSQYLVRLLENIHRLIPYMVIKQTLRVGNAATMISGMVRLILTKLSVTAVTNWIGLTNNANDGMNLLQQILSTILAWDTAEFQKRAVKLESSYDAPKKEVFGAIRTFVYASRDRHEAVRHQSIADSKSIIAVILETSDPPHEINTETLNEQHHKISMEYFSTYLSIRDREELTKVLCKSSPDILTSAIREAVSAMDPIIRAIHNAVDLSATVTDAEAFLADLIKTSKPKKTTLRNSRENARSRPNSPGPASLTDQDASQTPTVQDYVQLLRKHVPSVHKFLHQVLKNSPNLALDYLAYAKRIFSEYRVESAVKAAKEGGEGGAGNMTAPLHALFSSLPEDKQCELKTLLDKHETHLRLLKDTSKLRLECTMSPTTAHDSFTHGPGMYLSRWDSLMDSTLITPATIHGPVRKGWEVRGDQDPKGCKASSLLDTSKHESGSVMMVDGTGDRLTQSESKRYGEEEENMVRVWEGMRDGWVGVCRGLEVMGVE